ncbi:choice-of-anchor D domain-containing protein [Edaphobacter flagellatus]|uniref:choice-of-anchor D domain-containing protein n=1 Tax=Edaphobacter flagellatus TaxID=1933044 RepID=UPI0021B2A593|nr:choice-of-anchor D domain-containing protein [Edaphobacter flagellatus]
MGHRFFRQLVAVHIRLVTAAMLLLPQAMTAQQTGLNAAWQPLGPAQVATASYGKVTGRVTAIAVDPVDATGNTVYVGTTGGGVWKSTNARAAAGSVAFVPLTDTLPVFSANARSAAVPSLSIGALSAQNNIVLAGTGDPNDATDSYSGEGLLRSADAGLTWTLTRSSQDGANGTHSFAGLAFAGLSWSTATPGTVVAAVSQSALGVLTGAADPTNSVMGLYYSTDYGVTWRMSTVMDAGQYVQRPLLNGGNHGGNAATAVVWNPVRQRFYAAIRFHGYYESADGVTWTRLAQQPGAGLTTAACPANTDLQGSTGCPIFRGALAVEPMSGDTYALTVDINNRDQGLWRDACSATGSVCAANVAFAQRLGGSSLEVGGGSTAIAQGDYNLSLAAAAAGADTLIYAGTVDLYRCSLTAGCSTMRNATNALNGCVAPARVAPAQHAIAAIATAGQPTLLIGNDGGIWRSTDGVNQQATPCSADDATHFDNLNAALGSLAQVQSLAHHPTDAATLLAGMGANGTAGTTSAATDGSTVWTQLATGEGGNVAIDPANPALWYVTTAAGVSLRRCANGGSCTAADFAGTPTIGPAQVSRDLTLIQTPWLLDPVLTSNAIVGTCRVWRGPGNDGTQWSTANAISSMLSGPQSSACTAANGVVRSVAAGGAASGATSAQNAGSQVIYAGLAGTLTGGASAGGHLFVTQAAGTTTGNSTWSDVTSSPVTTPGVTPAFNPYGYDVSSIFVDPHDATGRTVYATIRGFNSAHVYRSTNAGASWSDVTRNLQNVPANAVAVDPNDANTVYVATDGGVYATTQITSCETTNCWSVLGTGLPNAPATTLIAAAAMPTGDGRAGELRVGTYGRGVWQIPLLTASSAAQPLMTISPTALSFFSQAVATQSAAQIVAVTNTGLASLRVSQIAISATQLPLGPQAEFTETDTCVGASIAAGQSCSISVMFVPAAAGARSSTMTVYANVAGGQGTVALSGTATTAGAVVLTPVALSFPQTAVNATSAAENITVSNTGGSTIALGAASVTGDFAITANTCSSTLGASAGCTVAIAFTPKTSGARTGTFSIAGNGGPLTATLSGGAVLPATDALAPMSLTFAAQALGTTSAVQQVTLTNTGDVALTLIAAQTTGDFAATNACGNSLAAHSTCAVMVVFQPKSLGLASGVLTVSDQYRTQTVALAGTGVAPAGVSLSPLFGLTFPATGVGLSSAPQAVTLTNNGGVPLALSTLAISGDFVVVPGSNTCGSTVAAGAACSLQIAFAPGVSGTRNGALTVASNAPNSPHTLSLAGPGVDFRLEGNGSTTATIASGQNAVFPLLFTSGAAVAGQSAALTCSGAPQNASCRITPATMAIDGNATTVAVTVLTGTTNAAVRRSGEMGWAVLLLPAGVFAMRRRRIVSVLALCAVLAANGCGAGRLIPSRTGPGSGGGGVVTPAGTYNMTVTATSAGLTRTVNLTLIVQ